MWPTDENWRKGQYGSPSAPVSTTALPTTPPRRSAHAACTTPGQDHRRHRGHLLTNLAGDPGDDDGLAPEWCRRHGRSFGAGWWAGRLWTPAHLVSHTVLSASFRR